tara:strand:- start:228 stop:401 length:174 start_codon:yes stop_codon:yes gene_type:complete
MQKIYEEILKDLLAYRGAVHPFVAKNTKRGESWHEPSMQHLQKLLNKYSKLAKDTQD